MPRSSSGRWVARAGATGGGRTYRGQAPVNWYMALVLIVILGLGSIVFARYEYERGKQADTIPPTTKTTWFAGYSIDVCGKQLSPLAENETDVTKQSFFTTGSGVIVIRPRSTADAGPGAVVGKFVKGYSGLGLTSTSLTVPASLVKKKRTSSTTTTTTSTTTAPAPLTSTTASTAAPSTTGSGATSTTSAGSTGSTSKVRKAHKPSTTTTKPSKKSTTTTKPSKKVTPLKEKPATVTYRNGESCPAGTKDAGKKADVVETYWKNAFAATQKPVTVPGNPATLLFSSNQLITIGFVPPGTKLPKPSSAVVKALLAASAPPTTTTTTAPATTTTAATASTTTTAAGAATASTTTTTTTTSS